MSADPVCLRSHPAVQVRGVIIASGLRRGIFTAGQDLREIYAPLTTQEKTRCGEDSSYAFEAGGSWEVREDTRQGLAQHAQQCLWRLRCCKTAPA